MNFAMRAHNLSKTYHTEEDRALTAKESLLQLFHPSPRLSVEAIKTTDLEVPRGQALGIIGENGAGKTTLLKLLCGIAEPTTGVVETEGSIVSLIELGAGLQPELSGVENIYLNGAILGLNARRIDGLFPRIVEFSGLERFIHTPVKHYSSGMFLRLAFSVAVHSDPDILLVDEHLQVGDLGFQSRCMASIRDMKKRGKTVVFVTHSLDLAEALSDRVLWLRDGEIVRSGRPGETIADYEKHIVDMPLQPWSEELRSQAGMIHIAGRFGAGDCVIRDLTFFGPDGQPARSLIEGEPASLELRLEALREIPNLNIEVSFVREDGVIVFLASAYDRIHQLKAPAGRSLVRIDFDELRLRPGRYLATPSLSPDDDATAFFDNHFNLHFFRVEKKRDGQIVTPLRLPFRIEVEPGAGR